MELQERQERLAKIAGKAPSVSGSWSLNREMAMQYRDAFRSALEAAMQAARAELKVSKREEL